MASDPALVSCLCVTHDRPEFLPWVLWCFDRQRYAAKELVIVDSTAVPLRLPNRIDVRRVHTPGLVGVAAKRNIALAEARGCWITWFDDDDWQHPNKLSWIAQAPPADVVGPTSSYFVDLGGMRAAAFRGRRIIFNGAGFRTQLARTVRFDERMRRASDTPWLRELLRRGRQARLARGPSFFWLSHTENLSNPASGKRFDLALAEVRAAVTAESWGDTDRALARLRHRATSAQLRRRHHDPVWD